MIHFYVGNDPRHWIERAEKARAAAESISDAELKRRMLEVAAGYERLAERAARRRNRRGSP